MQQIKYWLCVCIFLAGLPQILIAEENNNVDEQDRRGITGTYHEGQIPDEMLEMSLARIRQLFAHEVGHTLGMHTMRKQDRLSR